MLDTVIKRRITGMLGPRWKHRDISERAGIFRAEVSMALMCTGDEECKARHTPQVQEAISKAVGLSTGKLFGQHAWFRLCDHQRNTATKNSGARRQPKRITA